jgi:hypothetical protein
MMRVAVYLNSINVYIISLLHETRATTLELVLFITAIIYIKTDHHTARQLA